MAVSMFFGLPGAGKTTLLASMAIKALKKKKYQNVYSNVHLNIDGIKFITAKDLMVYNIHDGLILFDEASIDFNGRLFKQQSMKVIEFFLLHRHPRTDICVFSQANNIDKTIRTIADRCYYIHKGILTGHWFSKYYRIPYTMFLKDKNDTSGDNPGEINFGYYKPDFFTRVFCTWVYRPKYYKYYDSWAFPELPDLPDDRTYHSPKILHSKRFPAKKLQPYLEIPEELIPKPEQEKREAL